MAPSFHSINAALGWLFQAAALDGNWQQLLAVLGLKARTHLLCSCFPELQLALRACCFSSCLLSVPAVTQPLALVKLEWGKAKPFSDPLGGHGEGKDLWNVTAVCILSAHASAKSWSKLLRKYLSTSSWAVGCSLAVPGLWLKYIQGDLFAIRALLSTV